MESLTKSCLAVLEKDKFKNYTILYILLMILTLVYVLYYLVVSNYGVLCCLVPLCLFFLSSFVIISLGDERAGRLFIG